MRDIKFRIWNKMNKKFHNYNKLDTTKWLIDLNGNLGYMDLEDFSWGGLIPRGFYELNQYTGLKDKFGKEIYEGDIVNYTDGKLVKRKGKIEFECYGFMLNEINGIQIGFLGEIDDIEEFDFEIVGNIYENPELLER